MELDIVKKKKIWVPPRTWGVCIWVLPNGKALMDADGNALSAEGFVDDPKIESKVAEAGKYWSGSDEGYVAWIHGARKVSQSEREDQIERLNDGLMPDPFEDAFDNLEKR
jgi:hypothetical protein